MSGTLVVVVGATQTGKTTWLRAQLAALKPARSMFFDPDDEYRDFGADTESTARLVELTSMPRFAAVYRPSMDDKSMPREFDFFCKLAFHRAPVVVVVDELADVVRNNGAPAWWKRLVRRGLKRDISIYAASQRPADIDKGIWSQAHRVRSTMLGYADDQQTIARALNVPIERIAALRGYEAIDVDRFANFSAGRPAEKL